jgi:multidrug efflux pump subunit AcrA (membrane-fusion protein)
MLKSESEFVPRRGSNLLLEIVRLGGPALILGLGVAGFLALWNLRGAPAREPRVVELPLVRTEPVELHGDEVEFEVDGLVVPYREIVVSAEIAGRVKDKAAKCRAGNYVTQGTLLVEIDPEEYKLDVRRLALEAEQARVMIDELDVEKENTQQLINLAIETVKLQRQERERLRGLTQERIVSDTKVDQAEQAILTAQNSLLSLQSQLRLLATRRNRLVQAQKLAETQMRRAELDLARTKIFAPADGVVVADLIEKDSYVQKGAPLFRLEDTSRAEVKCNLRMRDLFWVWRQAHPEEAGARDRGPASDYEIPPTRVAVRYRFGARTFEWDGTLSRYDGLGLDERTRTVPCRVVVDQPRRVRGDQSGDASADREALPALVRGMYVTVLVKTKPNMQLIRVPEGAVRPDDRDGKGSVVWLVEDGKLRRQKVEVAEWARDGVLIDQKRAGFGEGARLVVSPLPSATEGMAVREEQSS